MNWFDALQCCYYQQGYLAEPQNQAEQDTINSYLTICEQQISRLDISKYDTIFQHFLSAIGGDRQNSWWMGATDMHHEGGWVIKHRNFIICRKK